MDQVLCFIGEHPIVSVILGAMLLETTVILGAMLLGTIVRAMPWSRRK